MACQDIVFSFDQQLFTQHDGVSMGSALGPTLASFAMDMIESRMSECSVKPLHYKRYVDDIFAVFETANQAEIFLTFLNAQHHKLKFTAENENNKKLVFLDTEIYRTENGFEIDWHQKTTNTGRYIPFFAYAPNNYKRSALRSLIYRAKRICSTELLFENAYRQIKNMFLQNGYTQQEIDNMRQLVIARLNISAQQDEDKPKVVYWKLPYKREAEPELKRQVHKFNKRLPNNVSVRVVFQTFKTMNIFPNKDKVPQSLASNIVYQYSCEQCNACYIGETKRHFITRVTEHIKGKPTPSEVSLHLHAPIIENFRIICRTPYTKIAESLIIKSKDQQTLLNDKFSSFPLNLF
jgi:hypothetical protein